MYSLFITIVHIFRVIGGRLLQIMLRKVMLQFVEDPILLFIAMIVYKIRNSECYKWFL